MQDVANANRFAALAIRADRVAKVRRGENDKMDADLSYLYAVTFRFLISTVDSHLKKSRTESRRNAFISKGVDQVKTYYGQAAALIERCLALHASQMDDNTDSVAHQTSEVRFLRALSERASLNLFMATTLGFAARISDSPLLKDHTGHLEIARGDLWRCVKLDVYEDYYRDQILDAVRAQFIPNIAAYEVLAYILTDGPDFKLQAWPRQAKRRIKEFWSRGINIHPLLEAELLGYFILSEDIASVNAFRQGRALDQRQLHLVLDRELYRTILRELPAPKRQ